MANSTYQPAPWGALEYCNLKDIKIGVPQGCHEYCKVFLPSVLPSLPLCFFPSFQ